MLSLLLLGCFTQAPPPVPPICTGGEACLEAGKELYHHPKAPDDREKAFQHFQISCDAQNLEGCMMLALMYKYGDTALPRDRARAYKIYDEICEKGFMAGCYGSGMMALGGLGTEVNLPYAVEHLERACTHDFSGACVRLAKASARPDTLGLKTDPQKVISYLRLGCKSSDPGGPNACATLRDYCEKAPYVKCTDDDRVMGVNTPEKEAP